MNIELFDFELPRRFIARHPVSPRDASKLLDLTGDTFKDMRLRDVGEMLRPGDTLVVNNTRVIPARLFGRRDQVKIEVTLHKQESLDSWLAFARPGKRLKEGQTVSFSRDFWAEVLEKREGGEVLLGFSHEGAELMSMLSEHGIMPLPPYIGRKPEEECNDREDYQTIFARHDGAVASPTAGLHFTERVLKSLEERGVDIVTLTLHVGAGTFLPVKVTDVRDHRMHSEWGCIEKSAADRINKARNNGGRTVAVGTTSLRLLESAADGRGMVMPFDGETDIFITPGYKFKAVDMLLTNFHLPKSTLFMLVSAFSGLKKMHSAYEHAKENHYRFYSYGDCCLLKKEELG